MSVLPKIIKRQAVLHLSGLNPVLAVTLARHCVAQMTGNLYFPNPLPSLATIATQADMLEKAFELTLTKKRSAAAKHVEFKSLRRLLKGLAAYVETDANADADRAENIILSAGMFVKNPSQHPPKVFTVRATKVPGMVKLDNKAVSKAIYIYQVSLDPANAASWVTISTDIRVRRYWGGLISGTRYYFRTAIVIRGAQGPWSAVKDVIAP